MQYDYTPKVRTGVCKCGHSWEDHHLGMVINADAIEVYKKYDAPLYMPQECEYYGCNEAGGMEYIGAEDRWVDHCQQYEEDPNAEDQRTWRERLDEDKTVQ